jgi:hypothetical protein
MMPFKISVELAPQPVVTVQQSLDTAPCLNAQVGFYRTHRIIPAPGDNCREFNLRFGMLDPCATFTIACERCLYVS